MAQTPEPGNVIRPSQFVPPPGGSGPNDPTVEARLARLEIAIEDLRKEQQAFRLEFVEFRAEMRGRLTNVPTTFQIAFMLATFTVATFIGATGLSLAVLRLSGAH